MSTSRSEIEDVLRAMDVAQHSIILCFFTGLHAPPYVEAMARDPAPATGAPFGPDFSNVYQDALAANEAIHDGAILFGRKDERSRYRLMAWSMRMFPPSAAVAVLANRGSGFNSCLSMSAIDAVDALYLRSARELIRFEKGEAQSLG